jgi:hypothetical protein
MIMPTCHHNLKLSLIFLAGAMIPSVSVHAEDAHRATSSITDEDAGEILDNLEKNLETLDEKKTKKQAKLSEEKSITASAEKTTETTTEKTLEKTAEVVPAKPVAKPTEIAPEKKEESPKIEPASVPSVASEATPPKKEVRPLTTIKGIEAKIQEYDHRIDILESDLARIQSNLHDASVTDNNVLLEVKAQKSAKFVLRDLAAKLDGNSLYDQKDSAGIWMPNQTIEVFHGPLKPGNHSFQIHAVISPLSNDGLKLPTWQHKTVEANFDITIPEGRSRKHFVVELTHETDSSSTPRAKLAESDYK